MERSTVPAYPSLLYFFNTGNVEGTNSSQVVFYICVGIEFVDWTWERVYMMKRDLKCALLMADCDRIILSFGVRPVFKLQNNT